MNFTKNDRELLIALGTDKARNPAEQLCKSEWWALVAPASAEPTEAETPRDSWPYCESCRRCHTLGAPCIADDCGIADCKCDDCTYFGLAPARYSEAARIREAHTRLTHRKREKIRQAKRKPTAPDVPDVEQCQMKDADGLRCLNRVEHPGWTRCRGGRLFGTCQPESVFIGELEAKLKTAKDLIDSAQEHLNQVWPDKFVAYKRAVGEVMAASQQPAP